jgi:nucleoside-diphosphate-sugar epimerase
MKVGITGGTGNISTAVAHALVTARHEVVCFNRSGKAPEGARAVAVDRDHADSYVAAIRGERLEAAIDMITFDAAQAEVSLRAFTGVGHLVHCSSGATYGFPLDRLPITEETPCRAGDAYGAAKHAADRVMMQASLGGGGPPVTIIKPNTVLGSSYGRSLPGQLPGNWLRRIVDGKPVVVVGDGEAIHHFLDSEDAARAFVGCLGQPRCFGQVINLCGTIPVTWRDYHEAAMRVIRREVPIVGVPRDDLLALRETHPQLTEKNNWRHMLASNDKLRRCVPGFAQTIEVEAALERVLAGFDPDRIPVQDPRIDAMLDDLVRRQRSVRSR